MINVFSSKHIPLRRLWIKCLIHMFNTWHFIWLYWLNAVYLLFMFRWPLYICLVKLNRILLSHTMRNLTKQTRANFNRSGYICICLQQAASLTSYCSNLRCLGTTFRYQRGRDRLWPLSLERWEGLQYEENEIGEKSLLPGETHELLAIDSFANFLSSLTLSVWIILIRILLKLDKVHYIDCGSLQM